MLIAGRQGARLHNIGQMKVTLTLNMLKVSEGAVESGAFQSD